MLSKLPDLAILCVFDHLPIGDIHNTIESFPQFESLVSLALLRRKSLTLIGDAKATENLSQMSPYHDPPLIPKSYSDLYILEPKFMSNPNWLLTTFPRVTTLNISVEQVSLESTIVAVCHLIDQWSRKLVSLKLCFSFDEQYGNITMLLESINRLPTLKILDLDLNEFYLRDETIDLPVLSRLEQFYFRSHNDDDLIVDSLKRYAQPNTNLRQIGIDLISGDVQSYIDEFSAEFCTRFTHLNMMGNIEGYQLKTFTSRFCSLVNISTYALCDLDPLNCSITDLAHHLSPLTQLKSLHMKLECIPSKPTVKELASLPQLRSVKFIQLTIETDCHSALKALCLECLFPCLESIDLIYARDQCAECDFDSHCVTEEQLLKCVSKRLQPLKKCTQLGQIRTSVCCRDWLNWSLPL